MRTAGDGAHGRRLRGLIVIMWRAGLRIQEALALTEGDLDHRRGSLLVRRGKGGRRREVGMDAWRSEQLQPWLETRRELRSVHCCASSTAPRAVGTGRPRRPAPSCGAAPPRPVCGDGLRRTSSGTPMPSRWLAKACR
jgi:integrase